VQTGWIARVGVASIVLSLVLWLGLLAVPFLALPAAQKAAWAGGIVVVAEVLFWVGALLAGKELAQRLRSTFNPMHWWQRSRGASNGKGKGR